MLRIAVLVLVGGCAGRGSPLPRNAPAPAPAAPFSHELHATGTPTPACTECHALADPASGRTTRPGAADHAPCDRCHRDRFFAAPSIFCNTCHTAVEPRKKGESPLRAWPPEGPQRRRSSLFDHKKHLDADAMEKRLGYHVGCRDCHLREEGAEKAALAGHQACAACHGGRALRPGLELPPITIEDCTKCHVSEALKIPDARRFITRDLKFSHARHERDKQGQPIACVACHKAIPNATTVENIGLPGMLDCATCHEDSKRTGEQARIANCSVCHTEIQAGVAPRDHLGGGTAPDTHTIPFRTEHADAARSPEARCRFCHGGMSASTKDNCFECHVVMKPRDHTLRWATTDHGPESAMRRERCASCHEADYCARCHSQRPRSHVPFDAFIAGGHALEARLNLRACMACHDFATTCGRCHQGPAFPSGRPQ